jgi:hypothetical protein
MGEDGILKELAGWVAIIKEEDDEGNKSEIRTNLLLLHLSRGDAQVKRMASFLIDLYDKCFPEFPVDLTKALKKELFLYLERWIKENLSYRFILNGISDLIVHLYRSGNEELKDTLWDNINRWKAPGDKEAELDTFVDNISKRIFDI